MTSKSKPVFVLIGMTGAGKSTVSSIVTKSLGLDRIKTTTTRPQRNAEDTEYVFTTADKFTANDGRYIAVRKYTALIEGYSKDYYYGVDKLALERGGLLITDFDGLQELFERKIDVVGIYLYSDPKTRLQRAERRPGFVLPEFERRNADDLVRFDIQKIIEVGKHNRLYIVDNSGADISTVCEKVEDIILNYL